MPQELIDLNEIVTSPSPSSSTKAKPKAKVPATTETVDLSEPQPSQIQQQESGGLDGKLFLPPTLSPAQQAGELGIGFAEGAGQSVGQMVKGGWNLARKMTTQSVPTFPGGGSGQLSMIPPVPESLERATQSKRQFGLEKGKENDPAMTVGRVATDMAMFAVPATGANKMVEAAGALGKFGPAATRVATDAALGGGMEYLRSGGDADAAATSALHAGALSGAFQTVGGILRSVAPVLYKSGQIRFKERYSLEDIDKAFDIGFANDIPITRDGMKKLAGLQNDFHSNTKQFVNAFGNEPVQITDALKPLQKLRALAVDAEETNLINRIDERMREFQNGRVTLPLKEVYAKTKALQAIAAKAFGSDGTARANFNAKLSTGLLAEMGEISPEIKLIGQNERSALILKNAINSYLKKNPGVTPQAVASLFASGALVGGAANQVGGGVGISALAATSPSLVYALWQSPQVRSSMAIALKAAGRVMSPTYGMGLPSTKTQMRVPTAPPGPKGLLGAPPEQLGSFETSSDREVYMGALRKKPSPGPASVPPSRQLPPASSTPFNRDNTISMRSADAGERAVLGQETGPEFSARRNPTGERRVSTQRQLPPAGSVQTPGYAVQQHNPNVVNIGDNELVPWLNPSTKQIQYVPKWYIKNGGVK